MDGIDFIGQLTLRFPEVSGTLRPEGRTLLHVGMADFRPAVEAAMDAGRYWRAYQYLHFLDGCIDAADEALANAIDVSFVEDFAVGEYTAERHRAVRERMPDRLRRRVVAVNSRWR